MRPESLPCGASCYKQVGPFCGDEIPKGLRREHRLKEGVWGKVTILNGALTFIWDDGSGDIERLVAPAYIIVPPTVPHHLEDADSAEISIAFHTL